MEFFREGPRATDVPLRTDLPDSLPPVPRVWDAPAILRQPVEFLADDSPNLAAAHVEGSSGPPASYDITSPDEHVEEVSTPAAAGDHLSPPAEPPDATPPLPGDMLQRPMSDPANVPAPGFGLVHFESPGPAPAAGAAEEQPATTDASPEDIAYVDTGMSPPTKEVVAPPTNEIRSPAGGEEVGETVVADSRGAWQAARVAHNFSEGTGQFLPPVFMDDAQADELFQESFQPDFDQFVEARTEAVESLVEELRTLVPQVHETVRAGMQAAVEEGYVPEDVLDRLEPAFAQTAIQVVDQSVLGDDLAVYEQTTDIVTIGAEAADYDPEQTVAHEIGGHKVSGGTFVTRGGETVRVRRGFVNHEEGVITSGRHYGLDEAVQHHLILSYKHGQLDTVEPDARAERDMSYYEHRKLLAEFVLRSGGVVDLKAITRGSFEDSRQSGAVTTDRRTMITQARAAYGPGAYFRLNQLYESMDFDEMTAEELAARIHGPEFNADGSIKRPGFIDVEGL